VPQVHFSSQRFLRVDVESWGLSLTLQAIGADFGRTAGLCGDFDGDAFNDFRRGTAADEALTFKHVNEFVERWRYFEDTFPEFSAVRQFFVVCFFRKLTMTMNIKSHAAA
jgi:hypothetical protein